MKRFKDFATEQVLDGEKMRIKDILNIEVEILSFRINDSKYQDQHDKSKKECLTLQIRHNNRKYVVFTGSKVIRDQMRKYEKELPFMATIREINKYYSLS